MWRQKYPKLKFVIQGTDFTYLFYKILKTNCVDPFKFNLKLT